VILALGALQQVGAAAVERTTIHVKVVEWETGKPIAQARLTLQFREPGSKWKLKRSKLISYSAKTDTEGRCKFVNIPKGTIRLMVIADRYQTYGKELELETDDQLIEIKLKPPQPLL